MISTIQYFFKEIPSSKTLWIAYSGGVDSHVLLHLISIAKLPHTIRVVHVNHQLSPFAVRWAMHCQSVCDEFNFSLTIKEIDATAPAGVSPEEYARQRRYEVMETLLNPGDVLVMAHHQDDQAETLLLQLFRGAGLSGLSAMSKKMKWSSGYLCRPLLSFTRDEILNYAKENRLSWIEDESNLSERFNRNYLRHRIMPLIKRRWPSASSVLSRTAKHCSEAQLLLDELAEIDLVRGKTLTISLLKQLSWERQANAIRYWLRSQKVLLPSEKQLNEIIKTFILSRPDANPVMILPQCELRRYKDDLFIFPSHLKQFKGEVVQWDLETILELPHLGKLIPYTFPTESTQTFFVSQDKIDKGVCCSIRFRLNGERFHPAGRRGSHPLKKLMQEWKIPPWERDHIPLIYINEELACVVGYAVSARFVKKTNQIGRELSISFESLKP